MTSPAKQRAAAKRAGDKWEKQLKEVASKLEKIVERIEECADTRVIISEPMLDLHPSVAQIIVFDESPGNSCSETLEAMVEKLIGPYWGFDTEYERQHILKLWHAAFTAAAKRVGKEIIQ